MRVTITIDGADELLAAALERVVGTLGRVDRSAAPGVPPASCASSPGESRSFSVPGTPSTATPAPRAKRVRTDAVREAERLRKRAWRAERARALAVPSVPQSQDAGHVAGQPAGHRGTSGGTEPMRAPAVSETKSGNSPEEDKKSLPSVPLEITGTVPAGHEVRAGRTEGQLFSIGDPVPSISAERVLFMLKQADREDCGPDRTITPFEPEADRFARTLARLARGGFTERDFESAIECARAGDLKPPYIGPLSLFSLLGVPNADEYPARGLTTVLDIARRWRRRQLKTRVIVAQPNQHAAAALVLSEKGKAALTEQIRARRLGLGPDGKELPKWR